MKQKAIILDRDGVINELVNHDGKLTAPWSFEEFKLMPDVPEAIDFIKKMGYTIVVLTNQPDVNDGKLSLSDLDKMDKVLKKLGIDYIDNVLERDSWCYKPNSGALEYWSYCYDHQYFIGDTWKDTVCAHKANIKSIHCDWDYMYGAPEEYFHIKPNYTVRNLLEAAQLIERLENEIVL